MWPGRHAARADRGDPFPGNDTFPELNLGRGQVVVAYLETPVQENAEREAAGAAPTALGDRSGVARDDGRPIQRRDVDPGVYLREELRHDAIGRPADSRREHAWSLTHHEAEPGVPPLGHRNQKDATGRDVGGLERDAVDGPHGVGIHSKVSGDARESLTVAYDVGRGIDGRNHERLTRAELRRVLDLIVVRERLRRNRVDGRYREERLARRDRVDLQARRVLPKRRHRLATRDDHSALDWNGPGVRHDGGCGLREGETPQSFELRRRDDSPYRDHAGDHAARRGRKDTGPTLECTPLVTAPARLPQDETKRDVGRTGERQAELQTRRCSTSSSPNLSHTRVRASSVPVELSPSERALGASEFREARHQFLHALVGKSDCDLFIVISRDTCDDHALTQGRVDDTIAGAKARLRDDRGALLRCAAGPRAGQAGEHRIATRLLALLIPRAIAFPVQLGPRVALLCLDVSAHVDALARALHKNARRWIHVLAAV